MIKDVNLGSTKYSGINSSLLNIKEKINVMVRMRGMTRNVDFLVVDNNTTKAPILLGRDALKNFKLKFTEGEEEYNEAVNEFLNIDVVKDDDEKEVDINIDKSVDAITRNKLEELFKIYCLEPERPGVSKTDIELKIILSEHKVFQL